MKYISIIIIILSVSLNLSAQETEETQIVPVDENTGLITYQGVVKQEGTQKELFNRCGEWVWKYYANPVRVTKLRDAATGKIEGRHQFRVTILKDGIEQDAGMVLYTFIIELKDGRYRYTLTDFVLRKASRFPVENWLDKSDPGHNEEWDNFLKQVDTFAKSFIANLNEGMQPPKVIVEEEW